MTDYYPVLHVQPDALANGLHCAFCGAANARGRHADPNALCRQCHSPLRPVQRQRLDPSLRRMLNRFSREHPLEVYREWPARPHPALMRDLSLNGMRFTTAAAIANDRLVKIDSDLCSAIGRVTHCGPEPGNDGYSIGVEFVTLRFTQTRGTFVTAQA